MIDIPAGWLAIITTIVAAVLAAIAYVWKSREILFTNQIEKLELEVGAGRLKIDALQDKLFAQATAATEAIKVQADTYQRLARSLEDNAKTLEANAKTLADQNAALRAAGIKA